MMFNLIIISILIRLSLTYVNNHILLNLFRNICNNHTLVTVNPLVLRVPKIKITNYL